VKRDAFLDKDLNENLCRAAQEDGGVIGE